MTKQKRIALILLITLVSRVLVSAQTPAKTLPELQTRISEILAKPELASAMVGVKIVSLDTGRVLFEENTTKLLRPASNMKLYTVATALDKLSPDYRFKTLVYGNTKLDASGVLKSDLMIQGRGDPTFAARFNNGDYFKGIDNLATRIASAGVKRVEGDLVGDESYFVGPKYGSGWEWDDLTWSYGAEISPLTVNDNALDLFIKPGQQVTAPASITTGPPDPLLTIVNKVTTASKGTKRELSIYRGLGENTVTIVGNIAVDDPGYTGAIAISHPALLFVYLLRTALAQKGVVVKGKSRTTGTLNQPILPPIPEIAARIGAPPPRVQVEITTLESPPFSVIAAQTLKPSQNLYTELILRTLGTMTPPPPTMTTAPANLGRPRHRSSQDVPEERWNTGRVAASQRRLRTITRRHDHSRGDGAVVDFHEQTSLRRRISRCVADRRCRWDAAKSNAQHAGAEQCAREDGVAECGSKPRRLRHNRCR